MLKQNYIKKLLIFSGTYIIKVKLKYKGIDDLWNKF
jgi:hypothetical protein